MKKILNKFRGKINKRILLGIGIILIILILGLSVRARLLTRNNVTPNNPLISETKLDQKYTFDALLPNKKLDDVTLRLVSAEKRNEILVQGKPAQTKNDKIFLVLNLEIDNADSLPKYMSPVDVFRLVSNDGRLFAADVHSGMLEVQPLSTKLNKIAFVIDKNQNQFNLKIGELEGEKKDVQINFN